MILNAKFTNFGQLSANEVTRYNIPNYLAFSHWGLIMLAHSSHAFGFFNSPFTTTTVSLLTKSTSSEVLYMLTGFITRPSNIFTHACLLYSKPACSVLSTWMSPMLAHSSHAFGFFNSPFITTKVSLLTKSIPYFAQWVSNCVLTISPPCIDHFTSLDYGHSIQLGSHPIQRTLFL